MTWYLAPASKWFGGRDTGGIIPWNLSRKSHQRAFIPTGPFSNTNQRHCGRKTWTAVIYTRARLPFQPTTRTPWREAYPGQHSTNTRYWSMSSRSLQRAATREDQSSADVQDRRRLILSHGPKLHEMLGWGFLGRWTVAMRIACNTANKCSIKPATDIA